MKELKVGDLPEELSCRSQVNVAFVGLDHHSNSVHNTIWESFTNNRGPDRPPIRFRLLKEKHEFPRAKPKRVSYEWYIPKGIFKTNWLRKHLVEIPAALILFYDMDWDEPNWAEKKNDCASKIKNLKTSLQGRNTKIALVLVQKNPSVPVGDNVVATERAHALCTACELVAKSLFVLPFSDHLFGFILRLENAFLELTQGYYLNESKRVRAHKEVLNKGTHQLLFIRHQFKMAFFHELKQDLVTAVKHYKQAYANLTELRTSEHNVLEVKTVGGFINYKICHLSFILNTPLDAIYQFRKHVDIFKSQLGPPGLVFEHCEWLSKQFSHFGDLFEEAVKVGLTAIQTQHPGFYYQQAANHAITRKQYVQKLCQNVSEYPDPDPLEGMDKLEFYGQRPWRSGSAGSDSLDPQREGEGIQALQYKEKQINHSNLIIPLLSSAVSQFKKYRCPRMKRHLMVQIAEEYYSSLEYDKALSILTHVLWDYRAERWRPLVSNLLTIALKCAYLSAALPEFITLGLEFISNWILGTQEEKSTVQSSVTNVFEGKQPLAFPGLSESEINHADDAWKLKLSSRPEENTLYSVDMDHVIQFIECKVCFTQHVFSADQRVYLKVYFRSNCPLSVKASKLSIRFNNQHYNSFCEVTEDSLVNRLHLIPRKTQIFSFTFLPHPDDVSNEIRVSSVYLQLGSDNNYGVNLIWNFDNSSANQNSHIAWDSKKSLGDEINFQQLSVQPQAKITLRQPHLTIDVNHSPPVLLHEFYAIELTIQNKEGSSLTNVSMKVGLADDLDPRMYQSTYFSCKNDHFEEESLSDLENIHLEDIPAEAQRKQQIFMRTTEIGLRQVCVKVEYQTEVEIDEQMLLCSSIKEIILDLDCIEPFTISSKVLNLKFEPLESVRAEEQFVTQIDIHSTSPLPLQLESGKLELASHAVTVDKNVQSYVKGVKLNEKEAARDCFCLVVQAAVDAPKSLGTYNLIWKRFSGESCPVKTNIPLPTIEVKQCPLFLQMEAPAHGCVRTPLTICYLVHNRTCLVQDIELFMDSCDAFMYSGNKQLHFRILPRECQVLTYNLYPLISGYAPLPRLHLILNPGTSNATALDTLIQEMLPSHIFIMPQNKTESPAGTGRST